MHKPERYKVNSGRGFLHLAANRTYQRVHNTFDDTSFIAASPQSYLQQNISYRQFTQQLKYFCLSTSWLFAY